MSISHLKLSQPVIQSYILKHAWGSKLHSFHLSYLDILSWIDNSDKLHWLPVHQKEGPLQFAIIPLSRPKRTPKKWLINVRVAFPPWPVDLITNQRWPGTITVAITSPCISLSHAPPSLLCPAIALLCNGPKMRGPGLGFHLGLVGIIIREGLLVTLFRGPMLGHDVIVKPPCSDYLLPPERMTRTSTSHATNMHQHASAKKSHSKLSSIPALR